MLVSNIYVILDAFAALGRYTGVSEGTQRAELSSLQLPLLLSVGWRECIFRKINFSIEDYYRVGGCAETVEARFEGIGTSR